MANKIPLAEIERRAVVMHEHVAGLEPEIQSAVIAHLLATWLAGHRGDDAKKLAAFREEILQNHIALVRALLPLEDQRLDDRA